jgi:hypothetical protein
MSTSKSQILNFIKCQFKEGDILQAYQIYFKASEIESSMIKLEK